MNPDEFTDRKDAGWATLRRFLPYLWPAAFSWEFKWWTGRSPREVRERRDAG